MLIVLANKITFGTTSTTHSQIRWQMRNERRCWQMRNENIEIKRWNVNTAKMQSIENGVWATTVFTSMHQHYPAHWRRWQTKTKKARAIIVHLGHFNILRAFRASKCAQNIFARSLCIITSPPPSPPPLPPWPSSTPYRCVLRVFYCLLK